MEELTIKQKAEAYDKAIEELRDFYRDYDTVSGLIDVKEELANIFPEIKKSKDEIIRQRIIHALHGDVLDMSEIKEAIAWLEKQGEKPQCKSALEAAKEEKVDNAEKKEPKKIEQKPWSEEDNFMYNKIKNLLTDISLAPESIKSLFDWLKDLRDRVQPQTTWKPSDEQLDALDFAADCIVPAEFCVKRKVLKELLEQLKKLREE